MSTKLIFGLLVGVIGVAALSQATLAYQGDPTRVGPNYSADRHAAMERVFDTNDYAGWVSLMAGRNTHATQVVNANNFAQFAKAHELALKGDVAGSAAIRSQLGLGNGGRGAGRGAGGCRGMGAPAR